MLTHMQSGPSIHEHLLRFAQFPPEKSYLRLSEDMWRICWSRLCMFASQNSGNSVRKLKHNRKTFVLKHLALIARVSDVDLARCMHVNCLFVYKWYLKYQKLAVVMKFVCVCIHLI